MSNTGETMGDVGSQNGGETENAALPEGMTELELLKSRARMMGITFSNNIGVDAIKAKIQAKMDGTDQDDMPKVDELDPEAPDTRGGAFVQNPLEQGAAALTPETMVQVPKERPMTLREYVYNENMRLVRCRITNLDPKKKDLPGEIITVANEYLGTVRKFVPFGEHTEDGYHIPYCIYEMLRTRKFLNIRTARDRRTGAQTVSQNWAPEFSIEVLDPLTKEELSQLGQAQIAAGSVDPNAA